MELIEAIKARHSVRKYFDKPIERAKVAQLRTEIDRVNEESGLNVQLVVNEPKAFSTGLWKYGQFSGVENYLVMAGPKDKETEEKIGYFGEELVLFAQTIGLNSCWVGLTYKKIPGTFTLRDGDIVHCVIALNPKACLRCGSRTAWRPPCWPRRPSTSRNSSSSFTPTTSWKREPRSRWPATPPSISAS